MDNRTNGRDPFEGRIRKAEADRLSINDAAKQRRIRIGVYAFACLMFVGLGAAIVDFNSHEQAGTSGSSAPSADVKAQAEAAWEHVRVATALCDQARKQVDARAETGADLPAMYQAVEYAERECQSARARFYQAEAPDGASSDVRAAFDEALGLCTDAANFKQRSLSRLKGMIDGDRKPSDVAAYGQVLDFAVEAQDECEAKLEVAVMAAGGTIPRVPDYITRAAEDGLTPEQAAAQAKAP